MQSPQTSNALTLGSAKRIGFTSNKYFEAIGGRIYAAT
jgi:hypothetical protein